MFEYRQVLTCMRLGDTDRAIARVGLMGRRKVAQLRRTAEAAGWLDVATPLPGDPELAVHLGSVRTQPAVASLAEPHRERITRWCGVKESRAPPSTAPWYAATASPDRTPRCAASSQASRPLTHKSPPCSSSTPARRRRSTSARVPRSSTRAPVNCWAPGSSSRRWPGRVTPTPRPSPTRRSPLGSDVTAVRSSGYRSRKRSGLRL